MLFAELTKQGFHLYSVPSIVTGEVSEWLKEAVLKTVEPRGSVGSNPTFSEEMLFIMERCESGRIGLPAKELYL